MSPNMNPTENIWYDIGRKIKNRVRAYQNLHELRTAMIEKWPKKIGWYITKLSSKDEMTCG